MEKEISTDQAAKLDQIAPASKQAILSVPAGGRSLLAKKENTKERE
jgi:hypothetical protein